MNYLAEDLNTIDEKSKGYIAWNWSGTFRRQCSVLFQAMIICCLVFCTLTGTAAPFNDKQVTEKAGKLLNDGKYFEALGLYHEIAEFSEDPEVKAKALFYIGRTYSLYLDQYDSALKQFEKIIQGYPQTTVAEEALFNTGMVLYEQGNYVKAHEAFKRYIGRYPGGKRHQTATVWADSSTSMMATTGVNYPRTKGVHISDTVIRVLLKKASESVRAGSEKGICVLDGSSGKRVCFDGGEVLFTRQGSRLAINENIYSSGRCRVTPAGDTLISLDGKRYRGDFTIIVEQKGLSVINYVPVERYLYGVVPVEMPHTWSRHALMAQAVAARTYALQIKGKRADKLYDVEATVSSQVYSGCAVEKQAASQAVDLTEGRIMISKGKPLAAYFHSNSGGYTENPENVWSASVPYLKGVSDRYSANAPGTEWEYFLPYEKIKNVLNKNGYNTGKITGLIPEGRSASGRVLNVKVISDMGVIRLTSNKFRTRVGGTKVKSTLFQVAPYSNGVLLKGRGYGHGVGMSQWGAYMMARTGKTYQDILNFYYQNINIITLN